MLFGSVRPDWRLSCHNPTCHSWAEYMLEQNGRNTFVCCQHISNYTLTATKCDVRELEQWRRLMNPQKNELIYRLPKELRIIVAKCLDLTKVQLKPVTLRSCQYCNTNTTQELTIIEGPYYLQIPVCDNHLALYRCYLK